MSELVAGPMSGEALSVAIAQLPDVDESDDKIFTTGNAVVVLDGASAFRPVPVPVSTYAAELGTALRRSLSHEPDVELIAALARAIADVADKLELVPGHAPTSTVAVLRVRDDEVDTLVLGDTPIVLPEGVVVDERIDALNLPERAEYRARLARGSGYDEYHRELLRRLQEHQARYRNQPDGYWIAEAEPRAAEHACTATRPRSHVPWAVLATDGAYNTLEHIGPQDWASIATRSTSGLHELLATAHEWEARTDPEGKQFPRSKGHDDKAIATTRISAATR